MVDEVEEVAGQERPLKTRTTFEAQQLRLRAFANRLNQACDNSSRIAPLNYGRYEDLVTVLALGGEKKVTHEAVRKWLCGEAMPRRWRIDLLAKALHVDPVWLAEGTEQVSAHDRRELNFSAKGAVTLVIGMFQMIGVTVAFPKENSPVYQQADIIVVVDHSLVSLAVHRAVKTSDGFFEVELPQRFEDVNNLIVLEPVDGQFVLLDVDTIKLKDLSKPSTRGYKLSIQHDHEQFRTGDHAWKRLQSVRDVR